MYTIPKEDNNGNGADDDDEGEDEVPVTFKPTVPVHTLRIDRELLPANDHRLQAWLPDGYKPNFKIVCVWPFGLLDYSSATLRC